MRDPHSVRGTGELLQATRGQRSLHAAQTPDIESMVTRFSSATVRLMCWRVPPIHQRLHWAMDDVCEGRKALNGSGPPDTQQEVTMRLITRFDAASRSTPELLALHTEALRAFATAARGSQERSNALASLHNIECELATRPPSW
jgi:hypothetical protein